MQNNINNNFSNISYFVIDSLKNIVSYNLEASHNETLLLNKIPQNGQNVVDIFPQEQTLYVSEIINQCLAGNTVIANQSLIKQIVRSPFKMQILFISVCTYGDNPYAVCLFLPDFCQKNDILSLNDYSRFTSHQLRAPISNILSLANFENYTILNSSDSLKIKELLKNIYDQAEKLNSIITILNDLINTEGDLEKKSGHEKLVADHIVLIDDDPLVNMIHKMILSKYKKKAIIKDFDSPKNALEYIYIHKPDLILLDINMPQIDGWAFLQRLEEFSFELKVIIVSSSIDPGERNKAYYYKYVKDFIVKPLTREKLDRLFNCY